MTLPLEPLLWMAGVIHLGIILGNAFLPRPLRVSENVARLSPVLRHVFLVHWIYILLVLAFSGLLCLFFAGELADGNPLGRSLSAGLAVFWSLRLLIQLLWYGPEIRRRLPRSHAFFSAACAYLAAVFTAAALGLGR